MNTANKQITAAKSDGAKQLKLAHQELASQTQRAQQSEEAQQRMENELRETLQQLECTRRKAEVIWVDTAAIIRTRFSPEYISYILCLFSFLYHHGSMSAVKEARLISAKALCTGGGGGNRQP